MIKCWHYRGIITRSADENTPLPPAAQSHIAQCQACRRLFDAEYEIVRRLSATAATRMRRQPPPFLHARIMARINDSQPVVHRGSNPARLLWPVAVAAGCIALTTILLWPGPSPVSVQLALVQPARPSQTAPSPGAPRAGLPVQWPAFPENPLDTEMRAVIHDARGAVTALADNFFPEKLRQTIMDSPAFQN